MKPHNLLEEDSSYISEGVINDEILGIIQDYLVKTSNITSHKKRKEKLLKMMSSLIDRISTLAKNGNDFEVGGYLSSAAYFLEEFNFKEAQQIYSKSIEFYKKDMIKLQKEGKFREAGKVAIKIADLYHNK